MKEAEQLRNLMETINEAGRYKTGGKYHAGGYDAYRDRIDAKIADVEYDTRGEQDPEKFYADVSYDMSKLAKEFGGRWDRDEKSWYFTSSQATANFYDALKGNKQQNVKGRIYINVPFSQKDDAKKSGARWDNDNKKWFYPGEKLPAELEKFI